MCYGTDMMLRSQRTAHSTEHSRGGGGAQPCLWSGGAILWSLPGSLCAPVCLVPSCILYSIHTKRVPPLCALRKICTHTHAPPLLCSTLSGIFRDSLQNVVELLDDMFARAAAASDEPDELNFIAKHARAIAAGAGAGAGNVASAPGASARLFSNPPGDYGSMVGEMVGASSWSSGAELGDTWAARNAFSYGALCGSLSSLGGGAEHGWAASLSRLYWQRGQREGEKEGKGQVHIHTHPPPPNPVA